MGDFILKYWIQALFTVIITVMTISVRKFYNWIKQEKQDKKCIKEALLAIIHDRLYQACQHYIRDDFLTVDELRNLEYLYHSYFNLGGNGTAAELYKRCLKLKIKD